MDADREEPTPVEAGAGDDRDPQRSPRSPDGLLGRLNGRLWRRWAVVLVALGVSAVAGAGIGLVLFGYPPVYLAPAGDDRTDCSVISERAGHVLAGELQPQLDEVFPTAWEEQGGVGAAPTPELSGVRCGDGLRAWGTPLRPGQREVWLAALGSSIATLGFEMPGAEPIDVEVPTNDAGGAAAGNGNVDDGLPTATPANGEEDAGPLSLAQILQARTTARQDRQEAMARLRAATTPERLNELLQGDPDDVADTRRELLAAYSELADAQERLTALEEAFEAARADAEAREPDTPRPSDDPDDQDDRQPSDTPADPGDEDTPADPDDEDDVADQPAPPIEPPDRDDTSEEAAPAPVPPTIDRLTITVPSPVVPLTMGALLGALAAAVLISLVWLATTTGIDVRGVGRFVRRS